MYTNKTVHSTTRVPLAHNGAVTALCFTPDGKYLLSTSNDNRMRLWDVATGKNTLVHYSDTINTQQKGNQIAVSNDGGIVYHPNGYSVFLYFNS
jgi:DNA excision repair protein ERCC-8